MATSTHRFRFSCSVKALHGKLIYGPYGISKNGKTKVLDLEPPPVIRNVIFHILQEYTFYRGRLNIEHTISYIHLNLPDECDLVCLDVAVLEPEHQIDTKRAIVPAKYNKFEGYKVDGETYSFGEVYRAAIQGDWSDNQPLKLTQKDSGIPHWSQHAAFVDLKFGVTLKDEDEFEFEGEFVVRRNLLGEMAGLAPIPPFPVAETLPIHAVVSAFWDKETDGGYELRVSEAAFANCKDLSQLLEYRAAQTIWVYGAPGSGKEVFAQALHAGSVVSRGKELRTRSVAGASLEEFNQRLFASQTGEQCLLEQVDGGGTLFLDEFDKLSAESMNPICSALLRVLEADEFIRVYTDGSGRRSEAAAGINEVNWIFAGAFSTVSSETIPPDFWSRLTGTLTIRHPVQGTRKYAETLFLYFYLSETIRRLGPRHGVYIDSFVSLLEKEPTERVYNEQITASVVGMGSEHINEDNRIVPSQLLMQLAAEFGKNIRIGLDEDGGLVDSSRGIRQAAKAAFFAMRQAAIESGDSFDFDFASEAALDAAKEMLVTSRGKPIGVESGEA